MKQQFFKSLILGICCSFLFAAGSFASVPEHNDTLSNFEQKNEEFLENDNPYESITSTILELNDGNNKEIEAVVKLGDNFGEDAGYYVLDMTKSFKDVDNVKERRFSFNLLIIPDNTLEIFFVIQREIGGGGSLTMGLDNTLFNNPSNVHKVNEDGKQYLVLEDNNRELYWEKISYEDLSNTWQEYTHLYR